MGMMLLIPQVFYMIHKTLLNKLFTILNLEPKAQREHYCFLLILEIQNAYCIYLEMAFDPLGPREKNKTRFF